MYELLQIVEVEQENRVRCCAPSCNRSVYKKIHIVRDNGEILVLGEKCYGLIYKTRESKQSNYFSNRSRKLSSEERMLLIESTESLIALFEKEHKEKEATHKAATPVTAENYTPKKTMPEVVLDDSERYVSCLYCGFRMPTKLKSTPAKGFKCIQCKTTGATLAPRKTSKFRW